MKNTLLWMGAVSLFAYVVTAHAIQAAHLHFNYTDSVPVGLYRETPHGAYAGFCLPVATLRSFSKKDMEIIRGDCPGGFAPILKPLVHASEKHPVVFSVQGFSLDGKLIPNTAPRSHTHSGAPLTHFPFDRYTEGLWAISRFNPNSYDSRYFGPVNPADIRFYAKPLLTR